MKNRISRASSLAVLAACLFGSSAARAQSYQVLPEGTLKDAKATTGSTDLTSAKIAAMAQQQAEEAKNTTELSLALGALLATGNSRTFAGTTNGKFKLRREEHQLSAALAGNYGRAATTGKRLETTVENVQGTLRFDRFLGDVVLFLGAQARTDRFQGLTLRAQIDPGLGYYFIQEKTHQLWVEAGYDLLYDIRRDDARTQLDANKAPVLDAAGLPVILPKTEMVHSGRAYLGYDLGLDTGFKFTLGLEFLQGLSDTEVRRLNGALQLSAKVHGGLSMAVAFTERFDTKPLPEKERLDTLTTVSLLYSFF